LTGQVAKKNRTVWSKTGHLATLCVENSARPEIWARDTVITAQLQEQNKQCKIIASFAGFYQFFSTVPAKILFAMAKTQCCYQSNIFG